MVDLSGSAGLLIGRRGDEARLVLDVHGAVRWRVSEGALLAFAPDGSTVLALRGRRLTVLRSSDGATVADFGLPRGANAWTAVWETNDTLLALMERAGRVAIVRVDLDGQVKRVTPALPATDGRTPYVLLPPSPA